MSQRKRQKISKKMEGTSVTKFEDLSDSILLNLFEYFEFYQLYELFFKLNQRFQKLIQNQAKIYIDLDSFPYDKFLVFCVNLNRILRTNSNFPLSITCKQKTETKLTLILCDDLFKNRFSQLKSLVVDNIEDSIFYSLLINEDTKLYETIERLNLTLHTSSDGCGYIEGTNCTSNLGDFYNDVFSSKMKSLKYLKLNFIPLHSCDTCDKEYSGHSKIDLRFRLTINKQSLSHLQTLIIGGPHDHEPSVTKISFEVLTEELLPNLPQLKDLTVNKLHFSEDIYREHVTKSKKTKTKANSNLSKNLKSIQLYFRANTANEKKVKEFFLNGQSSRRKTIKIFRINDQNILQ